MNIKIEHTKTHKTTTYNNKTFGGILMEVNTLVTDAELILVECNPKQGDVFITSNEMAKKLPFNADKNVPFKPILISITEKIEVGDWVYDSNKKKILQSDYNLESYEDGEIMKRYSRILALPEHFSPKLLQNIVDGKLKEGKCLIECESFCAYGDNCPSEGAYDKQHLCDVQYKIKLNPHITIYPVEEKMYTRGEVLTILSRYAESCYDSSKGTIHPYVEWFEQNVK